MKKRIFASVLTMMILATALVPAALMTAFAASDAAISVTGVSGKAGDTVNVIVKIENNPGIVALRLFAEYDTSVLKLISALDGNIFGAGKSTFNDDLTVSKYTMLWVDGSSETDYSGNGTLVTLTFEILAKAPVGDTTITLTYDENSTFNKDLTNVSFAMRSGKVNVAKSTVAVEGVSLSSSLVEIRYKASAKLTATVSPENATNKAVTYTSSDTAVATVSATGLVTAKAVGTATITVTTEDGGKTATCAITVINNPTITIKNLNNSASINYGDTLRLTAVTVAMPAGAKVAWSVQGAGVSLKTSADGTTCDVTSTASGTVTVTAKIVDANGTPITDADSKEISASQQIKSNAGFFQKLIAFFKKLFGSTKIIVQAIDE